MKDEVETFVNARYISASEAHWQIYGYNLHSRKPTVEKLHCYLPGDQMVFYKEGQESVAVAHSQSITKFTDYFRLNERDCEAHTVLYPDLPKYYTWNKGKMMWQKHKRGFVENNYCFVNNTLGRTITLSKHRAELYYLLMLLHAHHRNHEWLASRAIITSTNDATEIVNSHMMNKFPGNDIIYQTATELMRSTYICLNSLSTSICLAFHSHMLKLKVGACIMLLRNLDPLNRHCNGMGTTMGLIHYYSPR